MEATKKKASRFNRLYCFFALFCLVMVLESISGVYMVSAVQSIERQFQIPSKVSGLMISATDFGYIPTVAIISYVGSKGNRARWIGAGCMLTAIANLMIAMPNFIFPVPKPSLNMSTVREKLALPARLADANVTLKQLLDYGPIELGLLNLSRFDATSLRDLENPAVFSGLFGDIYTTLISETTVDGSSIDATAEMQKNISAVKKALLESVNAKTFFEMLKAFIRQKQKEGPEDKVIKSVKKSAASPFGYCSAIVNDLRIAIQHMKCARQHSNVGPFAIIFFALFLIGIGRTMPWSLGVPLIDDNVKKQNLPLYFAGMFFIKIMGPIGGFLIGSVCNRLYYTLKPPTGLTPQDPTWIGAWWLGFIFIASVLALPSLALFMFPNRTTAVADVDAKLELEMTEKPKRKLQLVDRHVRRNADGNVMMPEGIGEKIRDFKRSLGGVLRSPIYTGALIGRILDVLAFKGYAVFLPKYLENHYGIPQYKVQMYMGMFGVTGLAMGVAIGSVVMRKFKLEGRRIAALVAICSALAVVISFGKILLGCDSVVNSVGLQGISNNFNYTNQCNSDCYCDPVKLFPVCDIKGNPYYSACHAGCTRAHLADDKSNSETHFTDCKCISSGTTVKREWCKDNCKLMTVAFFALVIIAGMVGGMAIIPGALIVLRSVPPEHRSISLGFSGFMVSLCATLPSPVLWGAIVDGACLLWESTCTGTNGACTIYNPYKLRTTMHITYAVFRSLALFLDLWVLYHAKNLKIVSEEEKEKDGLAGEIDNKR